MPISDRDPKFTGDFWQALMKKLGKKTNSSTVNNAQADGRAERTNQTAITIMRQMVDYNQANWDEILLTLNSQLTPIKARALEYHLSWQTWGENQDNL